MNAIMDAFEAHTTMSSQALGSERVRPPRLTLVGPERDAVLSLIRACLRKRPAPPA